MKLKHVRIENFRSIKKVEFDFPESGLLVLVGANNAGKSNIVRAIDAICGEGWFGKTDKLEQYDYFLRDTSQVISIDLTFDDGSRATWRSGKDRTPDYYDENGNKAWNLKDKFPCIYLGADRTLDKHVAFWEWTLLSKIKRHFHREAQALSDELKKRFDAVTELFEQVEHFKEFREGFRDSFSRLQADTPAKMAIGFKPYTPTNFFKTLQILVTDPQQADQEISLDEMGEGSRNTALLALLWSYAVYFREGSGILALEEPELFLHPHARRHLFGLLRQMAASGQQVVISTHSSSFVDTELFDSIGRVVKVPDEAANAQPSTRLVVLSKAALVAKCKETGAPAARVDENNIASFYRTTANPPLNEGFFARQIILVEGETEELTLPILLKHVEIDCDLHGVSILNVRGKGNLARYWRLFKSFRIPVMVLFDNDNEDKKRGSNKDIAACLAIEEAAIVDAVTVCKVILANRPEKTVTVVLEKDFEHALARDYRDWALAQDGADADAMERWRTDGRQQIKPFGDGAKGLIARYAVLRMCEEQPDFVPLFVQEIATRLADPLKVSPKREWSPRRPGS